MKFRIVISAAPGTRLLDDLRVDIGASDTGTGGSGGTGGTGGTGGAEGGTGGTSDPANDAILGFEGHNHGDRGHFSRVAASDVNVGSNIWNYYMIQTNPAKVTEGQRSLGLLIGATDPNENITVQLHTPKLRSPIEFSNVLNLDLMLPEGVQFESNLGSLQAFVDAPSAGVYMQWIGLKELTGDVIAQSAFRRVQIPFPASLQAQLNGSTYDDLRIHLLLKDVPEGLYVFDRLDFQSTIPPTIPAVPSFFTDAVLGFEQIEGWQVTGDAIVSQGGVTTDVVEGTQGASLCFKEFTDIWVKSANLTSLGTIRASGKVELDVLVPESLAGSEELLVLGYLSIPSQGIHGQYIGERRFSADEVGFVTTEFDVSPYKAAIENTTYGDLSFEFHLTLPTALSESVCLDSLDPGHRKWGQDAIAGQDIVRHFDIDLPRDPNFNEVVPLDEVVAYVGRYPVASSANAAEIYQTKNAHPASLVALGSVTLGRAPNNRQDFPDYDPDFQPTNFNKVFAQGVVSANARTTILNRLETAEYVRALEAEITLPGSADPDEFGQAWLFPSTRYPWRVTAPVISPDAPSLGVKQAEQSGELTLGGGSGGATIHNTVQVNSGQVLLVHPGEHHMGRLQVAPGGRIHFANSDPNKAVKLIIQQSSDIRGRMSVDQSNDNNLFIVGLPHRDFRPGERPRSRTGTSYGAGNFLNFWDSDGLTYGTLIAEGIRLQNAIHVGALFAKEKLYVVNSELRLAPPVGTECSCASGFTLGCNSLDALDSDRDGLDACSEARDSSTFSDVNAFNGLHASYLRRESFVCDYVGTDTTTGLVDLQQTLETIDNFAHGESDQLSGWAEANKTVCGRPADSRAGFVSPPTGALHDKCAQNGISIHYGGVWQTEVSGIHCFRFTDVADACGAVRIGGDTPDAHLLTTATTETQCVQLPAGHHELDILFESLSEQELNLSYRFCGPGGVCEVGLESGGIPSNQLRPSYDSSSDPAFCDTAAPNVCTELCPCDPLTSPCSDANACTLDVCNYPERGSNQYIAVNEDDGNACTDDACDPILGVTHVPAETGNACSFYSCDPADPSVRTEEFYTSSPFSDGNACTFEYCDDSGTFQSGNVGATTGDPCLQVASGSACDPASGTLAEFQWKPDGTSCGTGRTCQSGLCLEAGVNPVDVAFPPGKVSVTVADLASEFEDDVQYEAGCAAAPIADDKVALVRGTVGYFSQESGSEVRGYLENAKVSIFGHCEFGFVTTEADGTFTLPVEGGGKYLIRVEHPDYMTSDRTVTTTRGTGDTVPMIFLVKKSTDGQTVDVATESAVIAGPSFTEVLEDGTEINVGQTTVYVPAGTTFGSGTGETSTATVSITPFTTGAGGRQQMPADLPPGTDYTHAFDISTETGESPNTPVVYYFDNFRASPDCTGSPSSLEYQHASSLKGGTAGNGDCSDYLVGKPVPNFYYNRDTGRWERDEDGRIIKLLCEDANEPTRLTSVEGLSVSVDELEQLQQQIDDGLRECGQELWRAELAHFSPHDLNWYLRQARNGWIPDFSRPQGPNGEPVCKMGSYIDVETGTLRESIELPGYLGRLNYNSDSVFGYARSRRVERSIPSTGHHSWDVLGIEFYYGGPDQFRIIPPISPWHPDTGSTRSTWSGVDEMGRRIYGTFPTRITEYFPFPTPLGPQYFQVFGQTKVSSHDAVTSGLGGWGFPEHHTLHPGSDVMYRGDRGKVRARSSQSISQVYSSTELGGVDGGPQLQDIAVTREGGTFLHYREQVGLNSQWAVGYKVSGKPLVRVVANKGHLGMFALDLRDERLFITDSVNDRVLVTPPSAEWQNDAPTADVLLDLTGLNRKPLGIVVTEGGAVLLATLNPDQTATIDPDAPEFRMEVFEVQISENVAHVDFDAPLFGWHSSTWTVLSANSHPLLMKPVPGEPDSVVVSHYLGEDRIFKWSPGAGIQPLLWSSCEPDLNSTSWFAPGMKASDLYSKTADVTGLLALADGRILFSLRGIPTSPSAGAFTEYNTSGQIFELAPTEAPEESTCATEANDIPYVLQRWAGASNGEKCTSSTSPVRTGNSDTACLGYYGNGLAWGPSGSVWINAQTSQQPFIVRVGSVEAAESDEIEVVSEDGNEIFVFHPDGRHMKTVAARDPGIELRSFSYDSDLLLQSYTERGVTVTIQRTGNSVILEDPFGHQAEIVTDPVTGYATSIRRKPYMEGQDSIAVAHDAGGLLKSMTDWNGTHVYEYSDLGQLTSDTLMDGSTVSEHQTLAIHEYAGYGTYTHTSGEGEVGKSSARPKLGEWERTVQEADGTGYTLRSDGTKTVIRNSDGTVTEQIWGADWVTEALVPIEVVTKLPDDGKTVTSRFSSIKEADDLSLETLSVSAFAQTPQITTTTYNSTTRTRVMTTPARRTVQTTYDSSGRVVRAQVGNLKAHVFTYDSFGRLEEARYEGDTATTFDPTYNGANVAGAGFIQKLDVPGSTTNFLRDGYGRAKTSSNGTFDTYTIFDRGGRLSSLTEPQQDKHVITYAPNGLIESYEPPASSSVDETIRWEYDASRRVAAVHYPSAAGTTRSMTFERDPVGLPHPGRLRRVYLEDDDSPAEVIGYVYGDEAFPSTPSPFGEEPEEQEPLGKPGQVHTVRRGGFLTEYKWNGPYLEKEEFIQTPVGITPAGIDTHYDAFLREGGRELLVNGEGQGTAWYDYNDDSQVMEITVGSQTLALQYDGDGRVGDVDGKHGLLEGSSAGGNASANELITHDAHGRIDTRGVYSHGGFVYFLDIRQRDGLGRVTEQSVSRREGSELVAYSYDSRGQLETVARTGEPLLTYKYDGNGNRLCNYEAPTIECASEWEYSDRNELLSDGTYDYTYDAAGTLETRVSLIDSSSTEYDYELLGSLRGVKFRSSLGEATKLVTYQNDHAGRRVSRTVTSGGVTNRKQYVWSNALQIEAELDEFGTVISRFVYGLRPNVPELIVRSDDTYRVITDERGSPVYVVGITNGNILLEASYDEWGVPYDVTINGDYQNDSVAGWPIPHGFAGGLFDETTRLVRFGARDYDPSVGRWTAKDPTLFAGQQSNLYVYAHNDPMSYVDPNGEVAWFLVIGAALLIGSDSALTDPGEIAQAEGSAKLGSLFFTGPLGRFAALGREISLGNNFRAAPFGNRTGHPTGRFPHYHRRGTGEGQGIGRHRPWETKKPDKNFCDRF